MTEQTKVPITLATHGIPRFLSHIRTATVPAKVNGVYLKAASFRNSNDSALVTIFKLLGFIDQSGIPTDLWKQYRGDEAHAQIVLGKAIKNAYKGLFEFYPDAPSRPDALIGNWIRANTNYGDDSVARAIRTFRALCGEATFEDDIEADTEESGKEPGELMQSPPEAVAAAQPVGGSPPRHIQRPGITINVELQIPPTDDPKIYDNFFAAMRKHLFYED